MYHEHEEDIVCDAEYLRDSDVSGFRWTAASLFHYSCPAGSKTVLTSLQRSVFEVLQDCKGLTAAAKRVQSSTKAFLLARNRAQNRKATKSGITAVKTTAGTDVKCPRVSAMY
jgi:hypothetical protein